MARWHYPKWRRTLMQVVICIIFFASVGLAEWVVHDRSSNGVNPLGNVEFVGPIGIRRPQGWVLKRETVDPVLYIAQEPNTLVREGRRLTVQVSKVRPGTSTEDLLTGQSEGLDQHAVSIQIGSCEGLLVSHKERQNTEMMPNAGPMENNLMAGCVTPGGHAIWVRLHCPEETSEEFEPDVQLIKDIAKRIQLQAEPVKP